jgi:hypothetical protein
MRRLVVISNNVISNKKSKAIAAAVAAIFLLTSIHLAAAARMATLKQQQEQLDQSFIDSARAMLNQGASVFKPADHAQRSLAPTPSQARPSQSIAIAVSLFEITTSRRMLISLLDLCLTH